MKTFFTFFMCLLLVGCRCNSPVSYLSSHTMFDGAVVINRTEITQTKGFFPDTWIQSVDFEFLITEPGIYLFEGWVSRYRSQDALREKWEFKITSKDLPFKKIVYLKSLVYRLEGIRAVPQSIERDTIKFNHHGIESSLYMTKSVKE